MTVLGPDMLTIKKAPQRVAPGCEYSAGTGFEGHEFFEAPSIRSRDILPILRTQLQRALNTSCVRISVRSVFG